MKKTTIAIIFIFLFILGGILWANRPQPKEELIEESFPVSTEIEEKLIGGDRDEHGCLGPAGYSYDEYVGACTRSWELSDETRKYAQTAVESIGASYGLTVIEIASDSTSDLVNVQLQKSDYSRVNVVLENGVVISD